MKKKKILVVDNHPIILEYMSKFLGKDGHEVRTSEDGLHALDLLENWRPDIIFVDLIMPNIDGKKLCQIIRAMPEMQQTYLIILSAAAAEEQIDFRAIGANACIAKGPLDKMGQYVTAALHNAEHRRTQDVPERILGAENLYSRQITKELLTIWKHFEVVLGSLSEGILEITPGGRIVYANPTAISLTGIPEERLLASSVLALFDAKDKLLVREMIDRVAAEANMAAADSPVKFNDREFMIKLLPIRDDMKRTLIMVLEDVSEHRRIEAQFHHAQRMEAVGTLAGGIAHDFNNMLAVIMGNAQLAELDLKEGSPGHREFKEIMKAVERAKDLTMKLLTFARKEKLNVRTIPVNGLIQDLVSILKRSVPKKIEIRTVLADDLPPVNVDVNHVLQALLNICNNACDAMPNGGVLTLESGTAAPNGKCSPDGSDINAPMCLIRISDTGVGMPAEVLQRIFDPFFTTKERGKGTGLGLSVTLGIIKNHDGCITVDTEQGKGTTFNVFLPFSEHEVIAEEKTDKEEEIPKGSETVLIIDDEAAVLNVAKRLLRKAGYNPMTADNATSALFTFKKNRDKVALVVLDMIMPDTDAREIYSALREISPGVKVILASGHSVEGQASELLADGILGFVQKPYTLGELCKAVRRAIDGPP